MARTWRLTRRQLGLAEIHARRLDKKSQSRVVRDEPPITWVSEGVELDPLSLPDLYDRHVDGAFVPKGKSKAIHMLVLFPDDVKTASRAEAKVALKLAVDFAQELFGGKAVFAARMDRDEKSLTNADLFIAPRYMKKTKHTQKEAISLSRHLKLAAEAQHGPLPTDGTILKVQGKALQDAWAGYLRRQGYQAIRGQAKTTVGPDWVSPEAFGVGVDRKIAEADREMAAQDREIAEADRNEAAQDRIKIEGELADQQRGLIQGLEIAGEAARQMRAKGAAEGRQLVTVGQDEAGIIVAKADEEAAKLIAERRAQAERDVQTIRDRAILDARAIRDAARADAQAEADKAKAKITQEEVARRREAAAAAEVATQQLQLVERGTRDDALELALDDSPRGVRMNEVAMTVAEREVYQSPWSEITRLIARSVAEAFERARDLLRAANRRAADVTKAVLKQVVIQREEAKRVNRELEAERKALDAQRRATRDHEAIARQFIDLWKAVPIDERSPAIERTLRTARGLLTQAARLPPR